MKCALIYGEHNQVTNRRFLPSNLKGEIIRLEHGINLNLDFEVAERLCGVLKQEPIVHTEIILPIGESASNSPDFSVEDCEKLIKNVYAKSFVNDFIEGETRNKVIIAAEAQKRWIDKELKKVR